MTPHPALAGLMLALLGGGAASDQEPFDLPGVEKRPLILDGHLELRPVLLKVDDGAALARIRFGATPPAASAELNTQLLLSVDYEREILGLHTVTVVDASPYSEGWSADLNSYEAYLSLRPSPLLTVALGKKTLMWGKAYAWNPVAFVGRPKDPEDPALALEGFVAASADFIRSFKGPLQTLSLTAALIPAYGAVNRSFGESGHLNAAGKIYLLLYDTDLDLLFLAGGSRGTRLGIDFARNIRSNLELHGEAAFFSRFTRTVAGPDGALSTSTVRDSWSWVAGTRYLSPSNTTFVLEFYRNGTGLTPSQMADFFDLVERAQARLLATGDEGLLKLASRAAAEGYGGLNVMKEYLYLRVSHPEPFGILYSAAALTGIYNWEDRSFSLTQELQYRVGSNLELRSRAGLIVGRTGTDFGEKAGDLRFELRARYYF
jgi:hypothetical protein